MILEDEATPAGYTPDTTVGWVTLQETADLWPDAPGEAGEDYAPTPALLGAARDALTSYAGRLRGIDPTAVPERVKLAQVYMARHLNARREAGNRTMVGPDEIQVSTFPLVLEARDLVRPWRPALRGLR